MATRGKISVNRAINQFNGGEISPQLEGRYDWDKYNYSAKLCQNFVPLVEGCLKRRGGTHFVTTTEDKPIVNIKFVITFNDSTEPKETTVRIDDTSSIIDTSEYNMNVEFGETIEYNFYSEGYLEIKGTITPTEDTVINVDFINIEDACTVKVITDPEEADCFINGVETKEFVTLRNSTVNIVAIYNNHSEYDERVIVGDTEITIVVNYTVYKSSRYEKDEEINFKRGLYHVVAIGGSGGAGGGTWGDNRKSTGGGGGGGAYYMGNIKLDGVYTVRTGYGGVGGYAGNDYPENADGRDGGDTIINGVISVGGGKGGGKGRGKGGRGAGGKGGVVTIYEPQLVSGDSYNGADANDSIGGKVHESYRKGGDGVYKRAGYAGSDGYLEIYYRGKWE